jgi:hypothetical protein
MRVRPAREQSGSPCANPVAFDRLMGRDRKPRIIGEAQIVVAGKVEQPLVAHMDRWTLWAAAIF